ncbi:MAG: TonB-dependent receptor [Sphingobacteriia bacterium]|jgi:hypothetical protein
MKKTLLWIWLSATLPCFVWAQQQPPKNATLSGYVKDLSNGEALIGASVMLREVQAGAYTNEYGFFSITVPTGSYTLSVSYLGYSTIVRQLKLDADQKLELEMSTEALSTEAIEVKGERANVEEVRMSTNSLDIVQVKNLPALFGEVDIMKTLSLLPGVQSAGDGNAGFFVRGGTIDQNLILLDEATVYNASHLLGFFSVFNSDALKDLDIQKGGINAKYGGRLSSVVDIRMKEGNAKRFKATGGIGLISSRLTLESPIKKEKGSFIVSARRSYADLFLVFNSDPQVRGNQLYFYDLNLKANYKLGEKDRLFASGYVGRDVFNNRGNFGLFWGNVTSTLRWNHLYSDRLFSNLSLIYTNFTFGFNFEQNASQSASYRSRVRDLQLKLDYSYFISTHHSLFFGANIIHHTFTPGIFEPVGGSSIFDKVELEKEFAVEPAIYLEHEWKPDARWAFRYGLRASSFYKLGPGDVRTYAADGQTPIDTNRVGSGRSIADYYNLEPRFSARYKLDENSSIKFSYNRMAQYMHLVSNSNTSLPTDLWIPSGEYVKPQTADQVAVGYFRDLFDGALETSVEVYHKWLYNQLDYRDNADIFFNEYLETEFLAGDGRSYGAEFFLKKKTGKFTGWVSYTLMWSERKIPGINGNKWYPAVSDRRHNISIVGSYDLNRHWLLSAQWVYLVGQPATFPEGKYELLEDIQVPAYGQEGNGTRRNGGRFPDYHRLDLSATYRFIPRKPNRKWSHSLNFSVYNAYGRRNAWSIGFLEDEDSTSNNTFVEKTYLFAFVPSVTWNFELN